MKIATFNIENIFHRDVDLINRYLNDSVNAWIEEFEQLMGKPARGGNEVARLRELSFLVGFHKSAFEPYVVMRRKAGQLFIRKSNNKVEYRANPLNRWNGWAKLSTRPVDEVAIRNKAAIILQVDPDVLILQEVEDRQSLIEFNESYLPKDKRFSEILVVPGNNTEGREIGIMCRNGCIIGNARSHANVQGKSQKKLFDKDLQEYEIILPTGSILYILAGHLADAVEDEKALQDTWRREQAEYLAMLYNKLQEQGKTDIVVAGTLNAVSFCYSLVPILRDTSLRDIKRHRSFNVDLDSGKDSDYYSLGAYRMGVNLKQRDYLLFSPELFKKLEKAGLNRKGIWPEKKDQWRVLDTLHGESHQASTHPVIWGEINL